jgi:hypothetical protein
MGADHGMRRANRRNDFSNTLMLMGIIGKHIGG